MKGQATVELMLSFLIILLFSAIVMQGLINSRISMPKENLAIAYAIATSCYDFSSTYIKENILCIEGQCYGTTNFNISENPCTKSSILG